MDIKIKYSDGVEVLKVIEKGDWIDLRSRETVVLATGNYYEIPLGVAMKLPDGYEAIVVPRSSTFKKYGIIQTNSIGIIDNSYCGDNDEWKMPVLATRKTTINAGDRICQFRIHKKMTKPVLKSVAHLSDTNRGGFGSTGVK